MRNGGNAMMPGAPRMPAFKDRFSDGDIDAALAFIKTM